METIEFFYLYKREEKTYKRVLLTEGEYSFVPQPDSAIRLEGFMGGKEEVVFLPNMEKYYHIFD